MRIALFIAIILAWGSMSEARLIDRVVAFVDDYAITEKDLDEAYAKAAPSSQSRADVLDSIIDRYLLLREARRAHIDYDNEDKAIAEFLNIKVRSAILIPEDRIRAYYDAHTDAFTGRPYEEARDSIEQSMMGDEFVIRLKELTKQLRAASRIRILTQ